MDAFMSTLTDITDILWGPWTPWVLLAAGVLFTVWTRFAQYTAMTHGVAVVRGVYDDPDDPGAINHFQALSAALSATVGLGNIGGVALAIGAGGPGALFWMWITGVFGMALKTVEITLAMQYRNTDDPENPHGGAMWVIERVVGDKGGVWKKVARAIGVFFCATLIVSSFTGGNMFQSWNVASLTDTYFGVPRIATGIVMAIVVGLVVIGGIKRIGHVAAKLVPFMCVLYLLSAFAVLAMHVVDIPGLLGLVISSAFDSQEATGAFIGGSMGFAFIQGMKRALFSNEAGQGSAPIAHAAAKTSEPAREGLVGGIGPFIDTLCICTVTALVILTTGTWNREAIGPITAEVTLARDAEATIPTFKVSGPSELSVLPQSRYGEWELGAQLFLVGEVEGAVNLETGISLLQVEAEIVEVKGDTPEAAATLAIEWAPVEFDPKDWEGEPAQVFTRGADVHRKYDGAPLTAHAFDRQFLGLGKWLVTLAAWLFAISTMISWSYYGEQGMVYMLGSASVLPYKLVFLVLAIYACTITSVDDIETLMDLGTGAMLWSNIPIVLGCGFLSVRCLSDYGKKLKAGEFKRHGARDYDDMANE